MGAKETIYIGKETLENLYVNEKLSCVKIAKILGCNNKTVQHRLCKFGIPTRIGGEGKSTKRENMRFGKLRVIRWFAKGLWLCQCDCGNEIKVTTHNLNRWKSCGCMHNQKGDKTANYTGYKELTGSYISAVRKCAQKRNISFDDSLTAEHLYNMLVLQNFQCALSGLPIAFADKTASLDRIDSSKPYTKDNVQWLHRKINQMKWQFDETQFVELCGKVYNYHQNGV
jgi:hypothetical protein